MEWSKKAKKRFHRLNKENIAETFHMLLLKLLEESEAKALPMTNF